MNETTNTPAPRDTAKHRRLYRHALIKFTGAVAGLLILGYACGAATATTGAEPAPQAPAVTQTTVKPLMPAETSENAQIEEALTKQGYFSNAVPLDETLQDLLHTACEESGVDYPLALAVIEQETGFRNVTGDDGASTGYMQVQARWNGDRMARLGVTDLSDPLSNFRVGCDCLSEHIDKYGLPEALTAYNSGKPGDSEYSREVMARYERWAEVLA